MWHFLFLLKWPVGGEDWKKRDVPVSDVNTPDFPSQKVELSGVITL